MLAAEGHDGVGAVLGPVHACLFEALADDRLAACFHDTGADEQAALAEPVVAHAGRVVLEVAQRGVQLVFLDSLEREGAGSAAEKWERPAAARKPARNAAAANARGDQGGLGLP